VRQPLPAFLLRSSNRLVIIRVFETRYTSKKGNNIMYMPDYGTMNFLYEDRLREAEKQRKHAELVRAATEYANRENRGGLLHQIKNLMQARNHQPQEVTDVRATAV
jgi:hypothetical protein